MSAKAILKRYLERNSSSLPQEPVELRQKVTAVAAEAKLVLTAEELDELAPIPKGKKRQISGDSEAAVEKSGDTTETEI